MFELSKLTNIEDPTEDIVINNLGIVLKRILYAYIFSNKIFSLPTSSKFKQRVRKSHTHNISKVANSTTANISAEELWACGFVIVMTLGVW